MVAGHEQEVKRSARSSEMFGVGARVGGMRRRSRKRAGGGMGMVGGQERGGNRNLLVGRRSELGRAGRRRRSGRRLESG